MTHHPTLARTLTLAAIGATLLVSALAYTKPDSGATAHQLAKQATGTTAPTETGTRSTGAATVAQHGHESFDPSAANKASGERWQADAALRDGMARIRQAVGALDHLEHGHGSPSLAPVLADQIQAAVNDIFASCKLEPAADVALHGLLEDFMAGAAAVRSGTVQKDAVVKMQSALKRYPVLFHDPTWSQPAP